MVNILSVPNIAPNGGSYASTLKLVKSLKKALRRYCGKAGISNLTLWQCGKYFIEGVSHRQNRIIRAHIPGISKQIQRTLCAAGLGWLKIPTLNC